MMWASVPWIQALIIQHRDIVLQNEFNNFYNVPQNATVVNLNRFEHVPRVSIHSIISFIPDVV